jgi:hypothetical protein
MRVRGAAALAAVAMLSVAGCGDGEGSVIRTTSQPVESPTSIKSSTPIKSPTGIRSANQIMMTTYTSEYGIRLGITLRYPQDRVLKSPSVTVGDLKGDGWLDPFDGPERDGNALAPLSLPAGSKVLDEATLKPACKDVQLSPPIQFSVPATLPSGKKVVDKLVPSNPEAYEPAIRLWCKIGVAVQAGGGSSGDDGEARVALLIGNYSSEPITVEMPALSDGGATWKAVSATVPAGQKVWRTVEGSGAYCNTGQKLPWADGRILVNGKPLTVPVADVWC